MPDSVIKTKSGYCCWANPAPPCDIMPPSPPALILEKEGMPKKVGPSIRTIAILKQGGARGLVTKSGAGLSPATVEVYRKLKSYVGGFLLESHVRDIALLRKNNVRIHMPRHV